MIPYYGNHGFKQFIKGKPTRFGFKVWVACTVDSSLLHAESYCDSCTKIPDMGLGQGPHTMMDMVKHINLGARQHTMFDNLFTSLVLLEPLAGQGTGATGTLREDSLRGTSIMAVKMMEKKSRG